MKIFQSSVPELEKIGAQLNAPMRDFDTHWLAGTISDHDGRFLAGLVDHIDPVRVVELGVASGWSSMVFLNALKGPNSHKNRRLREVVGVDLSPDYYIDKSRRTGAAVTEFVPELSSYYTLRTGEYSFQAMPEIGQVDFAFIDAHHAHPWATLDLIAILPFLSAGTWVALHDLNLCGFPRHEFRNRAPFYLFYLWKGHRLHSMQKPTMIGALYLEAEPTSYLNELIQILATPWELHLDPRFLQGWADFVERHFGKAAAGKFMDACTFANRSRH